ncbi:MAG: hypothetical protein JXR61_05815 [Prolixibacteraceae bacterium]|nr:hypothetical protein [Prolixibacteraceae bacterium]
MKKLIPYLGILLLYITLGASSSSYYYMYRPVFMMRADMESNVKVTAPRELKNPGKIYLLNDLIFINEKYRGIHVINNADPENPVNVSFIQIDGCIDMSVKGDVLYADNAVDLIALKMSYGIGDGNGSIVVTKRIENVFPEPLSPEGRSLTWQEQTVKPEGAILVRWDNR